MDNTTCSFWIQCSRFQYKVSRDPFNAYYLVRKECSFSSWKKVTEYTKEELEAFTAAVQDMSKLETDTKILKEIKALESDRIKLQAEHCDTLDRQYNELNYIDKKIRNLKDGLNNG